MGMNGLRIGKSVFNWGERTYVMGILNITPDSFSDGGRFAYIDAAIAQARKMAAEGADIIDVGGESTRPGAIPVTEEEEKRRVIPVIECLANELEIPISIDSYRAGTAEAAIKAGAAMINDVWGLKADAKMSEVAAFYQTPVCIMHNRAEACYKCLIDDMTDDLRESISIAETAGIKRDNIILDPGIGFGKTLEQNLEVMRRLEYFKAMGYPLLLGTSRKSIIGRVLDLPVEERLEGTIATTVAGILKGVDIIRVHDVLQNRRAAVMTDRMVRVDG
jgi:dihydropteroate synthase